MSITRIVLDKQNRMLRFGFGKHDGKYFVRLDLWFVGFRLTKPESVILIKPSYETIGTTIYKNNREKIKALMLYIEINLRENQIEKLDRELLEIKLCDLTPCDMMCILRACNRIKDIAPNYEIFKERVLTELTQRKFNYDSLLVGLI